MFKCSLYIVSCLILLLDFAIGLENNKHRYTQNTDFLLHEAGINQNTPKNNDAKSASNNFNSPSLGSNPTNSKSDFPPLRMRVPSLSPTTSDPKRNQNSPESSKRDYVAPNFPTLRPMGSTGAPSKPTQVTTGTGKRNYVAPNYPPLNPPTNSHNRPNEHQKNPPNTPTTQASSKRDYVNANIPNHQQGKVKDLINFYDGNSQKMPSYSSIVQGQGNKNFPTGGVSPVPSNPSQKPSFSNIVSGSTQHTSTTTTTKPNNRPSTTPVKPINNKVPSSTRAPVPPSSIVNRNNQRNSGTATDTELKTISEELLRKDTNNAARFVTINYQGKTTSQSVEDKAPLPLLTVSPEAWNIPTITKFIPLLDNYERDTLVNEHVTPQERNEENAFMDAIMSTAVIRHLMTYFKEKGIVTPDPKQQRDFLKQLWFSLYSRGKGKISSSGFEHTFVSELKNGQVSGLHNWIYFSREEQANRLNYLGYLKNEDLNGKGAVVKLHFNQQGTDKPVDTLLIGTSPELEIALYTLCFVTRVDNDCNLKLDGKDVNIVTYNFRYRSKNLIGSAFPQI